MLAVLIFQRSSEKIFCLPFPPKILVFLGHPRSGQLLCQEQYSYKNRSRHHITGAKILSGSKRNLGSRDQPVFQSWTSLPSCLRVKEGEGEGGNLFEHAGKLLSPYSKGHLIPHTYARGTSTTQANKMIAQAMTVNAASCLSGE